MHGRNLGRRKSHRDAMLSNMLCSLITYGRIKTTVARAKELRILADRMVTLAKNGTLHARREARRWAPQKTVIQRLFSELGPRFKERNGGYTRLYRADLRAGDKAPMALIEYVDENFLKKTEVASKKKVKVKDKKVNKEAKKETKEKAQKASAQEKLKKSEQKAHAEEAQALDRDKGTKKSFFRKSSKGTGRS